MPRIEELTAIDAVASGDVFPIVDVSATNITKKATFGQITAAIGPGASNNIHRPEDYGATLGVASATNSDGVAINDCFEAARTNHGHALLTGPYNVGSTPLVWNGTQVRIAGLGAKTRINWSSRNQNFLTVNGSGGANANTGYVDRLMLAGPGTGDSNATCPKNGYGGLVINFMFHCMIRDVSSSGQDISFDLRNNCYGTVIINPRTWYGNNVGILMRGGTPQSGGAWAGSGSDISIWSPWVGGTESAIWLEGAAGGYWIYGAKIGGGETLLAERDDIGVITIGRNYQAATTVATAAAVGATTLDLVDGTTVFGSGSISVGGNDIDYSGRTGNTLTGIPATGNASIRTAIAAADPVYIIAGAGSVGFFGGGIEGGRKKHAVRCYGNSTGVMFDTFSFNANDTNHLMSVLKQTLAFNPDTKFRNCYVNGTWTAAQPILHEGLGANLEGYYEQATYVGGSQPTFNGVGMNFRDSPMVARSGLVNATAIGEFGLYTHGVYLRGNAGDLQKSTDGSSWKSLLPTVQVTQAQYDALTPAADTLYVIVG